MKKKTKKTLEKALAALESAKLVHDLMNDRPPWARDSVMDGAVKGMWIGTPNKIDEAIKDVKSILSNEES